MKLKKAAALAAAGVLLSGCATNAVKTAASTNITWTGPQKRVVLIDPDVQLGELEAGGAVDPRADWTQAAKGFIAADIAHTLGTRGVDVADGSGITDPHAIQLVKLHNAVGHAILLHVYVGGPYKLPTKGEALDFTLGPGVQDFHDKYGADYALFIYVRDSYTSAGRAALMVAGMAAAAFGVGVYVQGGEQTGFASLVDLKTGNIVWFNSIASSSGDLRTAQPAQDTVKNLLMGLPL